MHIFSNTEIYFIGISMEDVASLGESDANPCKQDSSDGTNELSECLSLAGGLLRSQISCVEGRRSITMRELKVQIGNSG